VSALWWTAAAAVVLAVSLAAWHRVVRPLLLIRRSFERLARGDFAGVPPAGTGGVLGKTLGDIGKIAGILEEFARRMPEGGFSPRAILSGMDDGVLIVGSSRRILLANEALVSLLGLASPPVNRPVIEVFPSHELQRALDSTLATGVPENIEISLDSPPRGDVRTRRHLSIHAAALAADPSAPPSGALVVFRDVTGLRTIEDARREFLANVSHEFRTPLSIIKGYLETLADGAIGDREMTEKSLDAMHRNTVRLELLIDDLLAISRIEDRTKPLDRVPVDLASVLAQVLAQFERNIAARGTSVTVDWAPDARIADVDASRIEEVFSNLLANALRYGEAESPAIRIAAIRMDDGIRISIADNGPGIPLGDQPHIFDRFYRVHKDRSRDAGGTGLGLSIVKSAVEAHGGSVSLVSRPGHGAAFHITIPAARISRIPG
jgi:two-component system phosphate regulon sensor histidine kinase PhoR